MQDVGRLRQECTDHPHAYLFQRSACWTTVLLTHHNVLHVHHMMHDPKPICLVKERIGHRAVHTAHASRTLFFSLSSSSLFFSSLFFSFSFFFLPSSFFLSLFFPLTSFPLLKKSHWFSPEFRSLQNADPFSVVVVLFDS